MSASIVPDLPTRKEWAALLKALDHAGVPVPAVADSPEQGVELLRKAVSINFETGRSLGDKLEDAYRALQKVIDESWFVLSGGDNPAERCQECGCAGYGMLRDALKEAEAVLPKNFREHSRFREMVNALASQEASNG